MLPPAPTLFSTTIARLFSIGRMRSAIHRVITSGPDPGEKPTIRCTSCEGYACASALFSNGRTPRIAVEPPMKLRLVKLNMACLRHTNNSAMHSIAGFKNDQRGVRQSIPAISRFSPENTAPALSTASGRRASATNCNEPAIGSRKI
jgi:hypothetical protein